MDLVLWTRRLVDIDSTTGREGEVARVVSAWLRDLGYRVDEQVVDADRINVFARTQAEPVVVFSTHLDCVPPFIPSRVEGERIYGRGTCDAKGIAVAQVAAVERLRARGETRVGLLFVAGEERGSDGARRANERPPASVKYLVDGEPTDNRLGTATRGAIRIRLTATGRAAHSAYPELGESAIERLLDALQVIRRLSLPDDPVLGRTSCSIGLIQGGVAPNVIAPTASAELMFRTVSDHAAVHEALSGVRHLVDIHTILEFPPVRLTTIDGFSQAAFAFGTDIPMLSGWGAPLLFGPGSIHVAHTADEHVRIGDLESAVDAYVRIAERLL